MLMVLTYEEIIFLGGRHGSTVTGTSNAIMAAVLAPLAQLE